MRANGRGARARLVRAGAILLPDKTETLALIRAELASEIVLHSRSAGF